MLTSDQELNILHRILESKVFSRSPTSTALLKFLVEATNQNIDIKESVVGLHMYGDQYDGEKSNARIRVSIYHLRKKLEQYYATEGADEVWKLRLDKGQYRITFKKDKSERSFPFKKYGVHGIYAAIAIVLVVIYTVIHVKPKVPIWNAMFSNDKETVVYLGDVFGYMADTPTGGWGWHRDYDINSEDDFNIKKEELNLGDKEVQAATYSYMTGMGADAVKNFSLMFFNQNKDFTVRLVSRLNVKDIKEQNVIYVGPIKNNNGLIQLFAEQHPRLRYKENELLISRPNENKYRSFSAYYSNELKGGTSSEIAIVAKWKGMHDTQQFLFLSDHDMGVRATVEYFTNRDSLKRFAKNYQHNRDNFTAIFLVQGKERVDMAIKLLDVY